MEIMMKFIVTKIFAWRFLFRMKLYSKNVIEIQRTVATEKPELAFANIQAFIRSFAFEITTPYFQSQLPILYSTRFIHFC